SPELQRRRDPLPSRRGDRPQGAGGKGGEEMSTEYRTLFTGTLVQESALSVGGNEPDLALVDSPLARDGAGRFVLRGEGLAGALIATARKLARIPHDVSSRAFRGGRPTPSRWR